MSRYRRLILLIACLAVEVFPQQRDDAVRFQLAQGYERSGNWERAVELYENLYGKDSSNVVYFEGLRRGYVQLKRYDDAVRIIEGQLRRRPNDVGLFAQLGIVYARSGDERMALSTWDRVLNFDRHNLNAYYVVANASIESRMLDKAIGFYVRGRNELGDPMMFTGEIANLYSVMMNYGEATREYLKLILQNQSQLPFVQSRMAGFTYRPDARREAAALVQETQQAYPENIALKRLYAWLLMEGKEFEKAFAVYTDIDERTHAGGREVYDFAERALRERAYAVASKAFETVANRFPRFDRMPAVKLGYARSLEESLAGNDSTVRDPLLSAEGTANLTPEIQSGYNKAIEAYESVVRDYRASEFGAEALYSIGRVKFGRFSDVDGALAIWQQVSSEYARFPRYRALASLSIGEAQLTKGNLTEAEKQYSFAARNNAGDPGIKDRAGYRIAEVEYFTGQLDTAKKTLQNLTQNPNADIANDALSLLIFIQENSGKPGLSDFVKAQLYVRQRKLPEAVTILQELTKANPSSPLTDEVLMLLGDAFVGMQRYEEAVGSYRTLIDTVPESIFLDQAQMKIATVYRARLKNTSKALEAYQIILEKYPNSVYVNEARKRIRELRGESL